MLTYFKIESMFKSKSEVKKLLLVVRGEMTEDLKKGFINVIKEIIKSSFRE